MAGQRTEIELLRAVIDTQRLIHAGQLGADEVMAIVADRSRELTGAEAALVELVEGAHLRFRAASGTAVEYVGSRMDAAGTFSGRCIADREAHRCDDAELDERVNRARCRRVGIWPTARSCSIVWPWAWPGPPASVHR